MRETKTMPNRYRIMNRITREWWEGEANSAQEACQLAGWLISDCWIRQYSPRGAGGWKKPDDAPELERRTIRANGYIAELHKARKGFKCFSCGYPIKSGNQYYSVVLGGGGLGWLKFPHRVHTDCLEGHLRRRPHGNREAQATAAN